MCLKEFQEILLENLAKYTKNNINVCITFQNLNNIRQLSQNQIRDFKNTFKQLRKFVKNFFFKEVMNASSWLWRLYTHSDLKTLLIVHPGIINWMNIALGLWMVFIDQANVAEVMCEPQILVPEVEGVPQNEQLPEVEAAAVSNPQDASEYE